MRVATTTLLIMMSSSSSLLSSRLAATTTTPSSSSSLSSSSLSSVIVVGLNAAVQKHFVLSSGENLVPGQVHRAATIQYGIGGKGQDVAVTLSSLQYGTIDIDIKNQSNDDLVQQPRHPIYMAQLIGKGSEGERLREMMTQRWDNSNNNSIDLETLTVRTASALRTCTSIVGQDTTTELIEPSGSIQMDEIHDLLERVATIHNCHSLCIMGSMPPGCPSDTYAQIYKTILNSTAASTPTGTTTTTTTSTTPYPNMRIVIDSVVGIHELLQSIATTTTLTSNFNKSPSVLLKINISELCRLVQIDELPSQSSLSHPSDVQTITKFWERMDEHVGTAVTLFLQQNTHAAVALSALALTNGSHPAYLAILQKSTSISQQQQQQQQPSSSSSSSSLSQPVTSLFSLYRLPIPDLNSYYKVEETGSSSSSTMLYPIGAGDAVAAGTLAAWNCLWSDSEVPNNTKSSKCLPDHMLKVLCEKIKQQQQQQSSTNICIEEKNRSICSGGIPNDNTFVLLTAFAFGLACGSASCLQTENSVVMVEDVLSLFQHTDVPIRVLP